MKTARLKTELTISHGRACRLKLQGAGVGTTKLSPTLLISRRFWHDLPHEERESSLLAAPPDSDGFMAPPAGRHLSVLFNVQWFCRRSTFYFRHHAKRKEKPNGIPKKDHRLSYA